MEILQQHITYQIFAIITGTLLLDFFAKRLLKKLIQRVKKTKNLWDDALFESINRPLCWLIWVSGITYAAELLYQHSNVALLKLNEPLREVAVIFLFAWFLNRFINQISTNHISLKKEKNETVDESAVIAVGKLLRLSISITAVLVILQTLGYSVSGVLAFGGIGGIAIGFAAKDLLANFFGGLMIYLDRPFSIGHWIRSPDRDIEGTVEHIGWRQTRIRTFNKRLLYVPNSVFNSIAVENPSRMTHRRINETIGLRYQDIGKVHAIVNGVREMLRQHPEIDENSTFIINFNAYGASSLDFFIYVMTHTTDWATYHSIKEDVLLKIYSIIHTHDADIAFPTMTLDFPRDSKTGIEVEGK